MALQGFCVQIKVGFKDCSYTYKYLIHSNYRFIQGIYFTSHTHTHLQTQYKYKHQKTISRTMSIFLADRGDQYKAHLCCAKVALFFIIGKQSDFRQTKSIEFCQTSLSHPISGRNIGILEYCLIFICPAKLMP